MGAAGVGISEKAPSLGLAAFLDLLLTPRETLAVFDYVCSHEKVSPTVAVRQLRIGIKTWYAALERLEGLGLVSMERGARAYRMLGVALTQNGRVMSSVLEWIPPLLADSRAALEWELLRAPPRRGSPKAGQIFCRLAEHAERAGDFDELRRLGSRAASAKRPAEASLALGLEALLRGSAKKALDHSREAMATLREERDSRSYRKALALHSAALDYTGDAAESFIGFSRLRRLSQEARDHGMEADAWLGSAVLKGRRGLFAGAVKDFERGLRAARLGNLPIKEAKLLANLAFIQFFVDFKEALATADEALRLAREGGARILVARAQGNRALILAALGDREEALRALKEYRRGFCQGGEERGRRAVDEWASLVRRILRRRPYRSPADWRELALRFASRPPRRTAARRTRRFRRPARG